MNLQFGQLPFRQLFFFHTAFAVTAQLGLQNAPLRWFSTIGRKLLALSLHRNFSVGSLALPHSWISRASFKNDRRQKMETPYGLNLWTGLESPILCSIGQAVTKSRFKRREHRHHYQWYGHKKKGDASNFQFDFVINKHLLTNTLIKF